MRSKWSWNGRKSSKIRDKYGLESNKLCAQKKTNRRCSKTDPKSLQIWDIKNQNFQQALNSDIANYVVEET